ncbi:MAG: MFS transporter, partial [Lachnospiraceae bacterium]|nr:MFS transporter [Lachnospiraceae bacterium]
MKITKIVENPIFRTKIKSDNVKIPEMIIGYFLAPFCAMLANSIFGAYLNRYYVDVLGWTRFGVFATMLPVISVIFVVLGNLLIGRWIDNTRTSQGKARPYMLLSAPMVVVAVILLFMTPTGQSGGIQMIWIAVSYNLYYA